MAGSHAGFSSVKQLRLVATRIVSVTILFLFKQMIHALE